MHPSEQRLAQLLREAERQPGEARQALLDYLDDEENFVRALHGMARRLCSRSHPARSLLESHDLVQSAICTGLEHFGTFRGSTKPELYGWFRSIIRSKVARASKRCLRGLNDVDALADPNSGTGDLDGPLSQILDDELQESFRRELASLPLGQRLVLQLRIRGATSEQIARLLDLKPATVRKRESRAIATLRDRIAT